MSNTSSVNLDIDRYYLGMPQSEAAAIGKTSMKIGNYTYKIQLLYNTSKSLSRLHLVGETKDALAVDGLIKQQTNELRQFLDDK